MFAQRRHVYRHAANAMKQVGAELALPYRPLKVFVGGGDNANVHVRVRGGTDGTETAVLHHAQDARLVLQAEVADFIQKQRAAARFQQQTRTCGRRPRKRPFDVTEKFALKQFPGNGGAVHNHERGLAARRKIVERPGHQFLAYSRLPCNKHGNIRCGSLERFAAQRMHGAALADYRMRFIVSNAQPIVFAQGATVLFRAIERRSKGAGEQRNELEAALGVYVPACAGPQRQHGQRHGLKQHRRRILQHFTSICILRAQTFHERAFLTHARVHQRLRFHRFIGRRLVIPLPCLAAQARAVQGNPLAAGYPERLGVKILKQPPAHDIQQRVRIGTTAEFRRGLIQQRQILHGPRTDAAPCRVIPRPLHPFPIDRVQQNVLRHDAH
ncbi:MAG: hypothetical protein BWY09_01030 [Candidatus Hydrogenedentes bacterium ADurb.Bin179]|nr:MAG: hypothetical protein BWY09_01030 [Candidatus Hydrogenedentes bacterium ADurb.Bin179]